MRALVEVGEGNRGGRGGRRTAGEGAGREVESRCEGGERMRFGKGRELCVKRYNKESGK